MPNHNDPTLTVYQMVRNLVPFLLDTPENEAIVSTFTFEVMTELERCFEVRNYGQPITTDWARVGDEQYYTQEQKQIVADLVAVYIIQMQAALNTGGSGGANVLNTFLKKAKAGSSEVEYDQFNVNNAMLLTFKTDVLVNIYKKAAIRKALLLGCVFDLTDDASLTFWEGQFTPQPFIIHRDCGCC